MTKRLLDKKIVKISFNESPDDQEDYNCSWDLNFSSDEENFFKGKSEILWSRTRDPVEYPDSSQSFSDLTGRTLSSCSWHNDEFDMKSTQKVKSSLEAIEDALYEKVKSPSLSDNVYQECCDWAEKFPYIRIKGEQIIEPCDDSYISYSSNIMGLKHFDFESSSKSLQLEGKKLPIHASSKLKGIHVDSNSDNKVPNCFEEIIDGEDFEEYFAVHQSDQPCDIMQVPITDSSKSLSSIKLLQDKVLDNLVSEMWPNVISFLEKLDDKNLHGMGNDFQLPPITVAKEQKRALCLQRPKTEGSGVISIEFPKLESILSVSPKVLQKRQLVNGQRPNSEMSVNLHVSSKSLKSVCPQTSSSSIQLTSDCTYSKTMRSEKESDNLCLVLPALEEDFQDSSSVLRGFHIEPGRRDILHKAVLASHNEYEALSTSRESEYYLPPIEDKNYLPSNVKLTKNLFTFYGSSVIHDKHKTTGSAKYKKASSRPNTSVSKKTKSHEVSQQLPVRNALYITAKNVSRNSSSLYTERRLETSFVDNETTTEGSQEKAVTLFPIVTSLTPHDDKNQNSGKKGLLHTFLGGRKR